ncbi:hypothetical protein B0H10DRAFT_2080727, partial [Mycena sp. CBHHK59/15]
MAVLQLHDTQNWISSLKKCSCSQNTLLRSGREVCTCTTRVWSPPYLWRSFNIDIQTEVIS